VSKLERRKEGEGGRRDEDVRARKTAKKKSEKELGRTKNRSKERKE